MKKKGSYARGLLLRISAACLIFLLLYGSRKFSVTVFSYGTNQVIREFEKNDWLERLHTKTDELIQNFKE